MDSRKMTFLIITSGTRFHRLTQNTDVHSKTGNKSTFSEACISGEIDYFFAIRSKFIGKAKGTTICLDSSLTSLDY